jgi:hypothetical protein
MWVLSEGTWRVCIEEYFIVIANDAPYPFEVPDLQHFALLVIAMQRDFVEPGGFGSALLRHFMDADKTELLGDRFVFYTVVGLC